MSAESAGPPPAPSTRAEQAWTWAVLALALALRLPGLGWCLPMQGRPLSYVPDESTLFLILERMQAAGRPVAEAGSYQTPLQPILVGGLCQALSWTGLLHLPVSRAQALADPGLLAPLYIAGRSFSLAMALTTVWAAVRFGTFLWKDARAGLAAGALVAMAPAHIVQSHLNLFNVPATFWWTLAAWAGARVAQVPTRRSAAAMGLAFGAAIGTKLTCALALPALCLALWRARAGARLWATFAGCAALSGVLSFPPLVTDPSGVLEMFSRVRSAHGVGEVPPVLERCAMLGRWTAWGWGMSLGVAALAGALRRDPRLPYLLAHLLSIPGAILLSRGGSLALLIPSIPFAALVAAPVVARSRGMAASVLGSALLWALPHASICLGEDLRDRAERWLPNALAPGESVGAPPYAYFAGPPSLYRGLKGDPAVPWAVVPFPAGEEPGEPPGAVVASDVQWLVLPEEARQTLRRDYVPAERWRRPYPFPAWFYPRGATGTDLDLQVFEITLWRRR